jgi:hypothetical protein
MFRIRRAIRTSIIRTRSARDPLIPIVSGIVLAFLPSVRAIYRVVLTRTGPHLTRTLQSTGWSRSERGKNVPCTAPHRAAERDRLPKVTGATVAARATATKRHESWIRRLPIGGRRYQNRRRRKEKGR